MPYTESVKLEVQIKFFVAFDYFWSALLFVSAVDFKGGHGIADIAFCRLVGSIIRLDGSAELHRLIRLFSKLGYVRLR